MTKANLEFLSAVLLVSDDAGRLAGFYRDKLGVPLRPEQHGQTLPHWGCELGDIHFAIHPRQNFDDDQSSGAGSVRLAFMVFELDTYVRLLKKRGVQLLYEPSDSGAMRMTALRDPDGNSIELTELGPSWFEFLRRHREQGFDVIARWSKQRKPLRSVKTPVASHR